MQNKPNVKDAQINVNSYMKGIYEKLDTWLSEKNKPNSNPIKACPELAEALSAAEGAVEWANFTYSQRHALSYAEGGKTEI